MIWLEVCHLIPGSSIPDMALVATARFFYNIERYILFNFNLKSHATTSFATAAVTEQKNLLKRELYLRVS